MNVLPLVRSQLVPPRIKQVIKRQRLSDLGLAILSHRVTTVVAPAGYGKSVFISSLLEEPGWPLTAWLSLDKHDMEPSHLLYHLIYAVKTRIAEFGNISLRTMGSLKSAVLDCLIAVNTFIEELPCQEEVVMVLDDFHLIQESESAVKIIEHLLRCLPINIHLVIISRSSPRLSLYHQELAGDLWEIRQEALIFSLEETQELLSLMEVELEVRDLAAIYNYTEGWAVGLRLAGILIKASGSDLELALQALKRDDSTFNKYLNNELMATLPDQLQDFLLDSSLLPYLEADLCNAAFQCQDSKWKLEQLHAYGLLSCMETKDLSWRMHHLIAEYLEDKVVKIRPQEYITAIRQRAGAFFARNGDIDRAIEQAMICADWDSAVNLIVRHAYDYFTLTGRLDSLYLWINQLPAHLIVEDQWLSYFKAKSLLHIDDEALAILTSAVDLAFSKGDAKCVACCLLAMSSILAFSGDMEKIREVGQHLLAHPTMLQDPQVRGVSLTIALCQALFDDDIQRGSKLSHQALRLELNPESRMLLLYASALIQERLGKLIYARQLAEEALAMPFVQENERWTVIAYVVLNQILVLTGDCTVLEETCQQIMHLSRKYGMLSQLGRAHRQLGRMYLTLGRFIEARRELELAYHYAIENDSISMAKLVALELMRVRLKTGENAADLLAETRAILSDLQASPVGQGGDHLAIAIAGIVAMEAGELDWAQECLEEASSNWYRNGARQNLAGTNLLLAHIYLLQGREQESDRVLKKALSAAEAGQWINFWEWHEETIYTMCQRALLKNICVNWAVKLLFRWFPLRSQQELGRFLLSSDEKVQMQVAETFAKHFQESGKTIIHAFYLKQFRVFVNGSEVLLQDWKTQKSESLFKFLAANRRNHPKEEIIEQLWPDSDYKSGNASLRVALSYVRKAIKNYAPVRECVGLHRGKLCLNPEILVYTDYEFFIGEANKGMQSLEAGKPYAINALEKAAQLYSGRFLPEDGYDDWINNTRVYLHGLYLQVLNKLAEAYFDRNDLTSAWEICQKYLLHEPADEKMSRLAMKVLWKKGQKQKALSLYNKLLTILADEYDTAPEPETINLYKTLLS